MNWTIHAAGKEWGVADATIVKGLKYNDIYKPDGAEYSTREIDIALNGDLKRERTRRERAEADKAEMKNVALRGETIDKSVAAEFIRKTFSPVRERIMSMPGQMANKVNPDNPRMARGILETWGQSFLQHCRENMPE